MLGWLKNDGIAIGGIFLAVVTAFHAGLFLEFSFDNQAVILSDQRLQSADWNSLQRIWTEDYWSPYILGLYRPLTTTTFWINYSLFANAEDPFGYQLVNLLIHFLNSVLGYGLLRYLGLRTFSAGLGIMFFAVHPLCVEAVTNTVGRSDLLALFFLLSGGLSYLYFRREGSLLAAVIVVICALGGGLCKETAWVLPGILGLIELLILPGREVRGPMQAAFWGRFIATSRYFMGLGLVPVLGILVWRWWLYRDLQVQGVSFSDNPLIRADFLDWQFTAAEMLFRGLGLVVWPLALSVDYSFAQVPPVDFPGNIRSFYALTCYLLLLLTGVWCWVRAAVFPRITLFIGWIVLTYLPGSNFILIASSIMGERFWYIPLIGVAGLAALCLEWLEGRLSGRWLFTRLHLSTALAILVICALGLRTHFRTLDWKSPVSLFASAVETTPMSARAHSAYASALFQRAQKEGTERSEITQILHHSDVSFRIFQQAPENFTNVKAYMTYAHYAIRTTELGHADDAYLKIARKRLEDIIPRFEARTDETIRATSETLYLGAKRVKKSDHLEAQAFLSYARVLSALGDIREALEYADKSLHYTPQNSGAYRMKANAYTSLGNVEQAAISLTQAIILGKAEERDRDWEMVLDLFPQLPNFSGMIYQSDTGYHFNLQSTTMRRIIESACVGIANNLHHAGETRNRDRFIEIATREFKCSEEIFNTSSHENVRPQIDEMDQPDG
jgi:tetratricopeptide (TPR) repeat protein